MKSGEDTAQFAVPAHAEKLLSEDRRGSEEAFWVRWAYKQHNPQLDGCSVRLYGYKI